MTCIKTGAIVHLPDYGVTAPADIYAVGEARIVRFNGNPLEIGSREPPRAVTHELHLNHGDNFWRPDLGTAVVDGNDLIETY